MNIAKRLTIGMLLPGFLNSEFKYAILVVIEVKQIKSSENI